VRYLCDIDEDDNSTRYLILVADSGMDRLVLEVLAKVLIGEMGEINRLYIPVLSDDYENQVLVELRDELRERLLETNLN